MLQFIDTHAHLDVEEFAEDLRVIIDNIIPNESEDKNTEWFFKSNNDIPLLPKQRQTSIRIMRRKSVSPR